ncbi:MAG: response regulator [Lachnospiraceae bacterium]|nr:response regulator [Lachnospiraceae bacterium]
MYRVGYIDDEPTQYENFSRKLKRRCDELELVLLEDCNTKEEFLDKIFEKQIDVLLIDYKMAGTYGFNGTSLINYINDHIRDLECFILTAVDKEQITDGLVAERNRFPKTIFDTEAEDTQKITELNDFLKSLKDSAAVFRTRREQKVERYKELLKKKKAGTLGVGEEEFLELYKVLSSYGMVEKLPANMLNSEFEEKLDKLLNMGDEIIKKHQQE